MPIPADLPPGAVLDVALEVARATAHADSLSPRSLYLESVATSPDPLAGDDVLSDVLSPESEPGGAQR